MSKSNPTRPSKKPSTPQEVSHEDAKSQSALQQTRDSAQSSPQKSRDGADNISGQVSKGKAPDQPSPDAAKMLPQGKRVADVLGTKPDLSHVWTSNIDWPQQEGEADGPPGPHMASSTAKPAAEVPELPGDDLPDQDFAEQDEETAAIGENIRRLEEHNGVLTAALRRLWYINATAEEKQEYGPNPSINTILDIVLRNNEEDTIDHEQSDNPRE